MMWSSLVSVLRSWCQGRRVRDQAVQVGNNHRGLEAMMCYRTTCACVQTKSNPVDQIRDFHS